MTTTPDAKLTAAADVVLTQQGRADGKAGQILTLDSVLVAGLTVMAGGMPAAAWPTAVLGVLALIASATLAALVVIPRLGGDDRGSFVHWATLTTDQALTEALANDRRAAHVRVMSRITLTKYRLVQYATVATLGALALLSITALTTAIAG